MYIYICTHAAAPHETALRPPSRTPTATTARHHRLHATPERCHERHINGMCILHIILPPRDAGAMPQEAIYIVKHVYTHMSSLKPFTS